MSTEKKVAHTNVKAQKINTYNENRINEIRNDKINGSKLTKRKIKKVEKNEYQISLMYCCTIFLNFQFCISGYF